MNPALYVLIVCSALLAYYLIRRFRSERFEHKPFPMEWERIINANVPIYKKLPVALKVQLRQLIKRFMQKKQFHGCAGLVITDEIRLTIAAEACLLLLNRPTNEYYYLQHILVYPAAYVAKQKGSNEHGIVEELQRSLAGESWTQGKVILSWDDVMKGSRNFTDGHNVVLHEFAHQLDQESGSANGAPLLGPNSSYQSWAQTLSHEFEKLRHASAGGLHTVLDYYGATNPAEFFAVATETFFEKPDALKHRHPALFNELKKF
ncbi:MAG: zinc-dependent peptidase, partial [Pseudomonadales bacterium]|nr:zinc-dependent peptidase [Pseudomonadales bacterium]